MIGDSSGLFPHFLGILSKTPAGAHTDPNHPNNGGEAPHPFSKRVPPLRRPGVKPGINPHHGSGIFVEGAVDHSDGSDIQPEPYQPRSPVDMTRVRKSI